MMHTTGPRGKSKTLYFVALFVILVIGSVALVYGVGNWAAEERAKKLPNPVPATDENFGAGMSVYLNHCVQCHGDNGDGKGQKADQLSVAPGNFTDARKMHDLTDGQIYWQITRGRNPMPGFEDKLTPTERWLAVNYIRSFTAPSPAKTPPKPAASPQP
jgi:mono/diheme cytochrome c family protein